MRAVAIAERTGTREMDQRGSPRSRRDGQRYDDAYREETLYYDRCYDRRRPRERPPRELRAPSLELGDPSRSRRGSQVRHLRDSRPRQELRKSWPARSDSRALRARAPRVPRRGPRRGPRGPRDGPHGLDDQSRSRDRRESRERRAASFARHDRVSINGRAKVSTRRSSREARRTSLTGLTRVERNLRSRSLPHQVEAEVKEKSKSCEQQEAVEQVEQETLDIASRDGFSVGQLVKARYLSGSFYTAKIEAFLQNGQIRIAWADGDANDRNKQPEELRTCDENGKILEEEKQNLDAVALIQDVPQVEAAEDAKLTPAEREQAERIREFQRRQSGAASAVPQVRPKQQAAPPEMLDFNVPLQPAEDMQRLEEKLLMLSTQYLKLHEKITADTLASEKQMQEWMW